MSLVSSSAEDAGAPDAHAARELDDVRLELGRVRHRLRDRERQLADVQSVTRLGIWEWELPHDRITWSEEQLRLHGLDIRQTNRTFDEFLACVHPEDRGMIVAECQQLVRTTVPFTLRYRIVQPDGSVRWLLAHGQMMPDEAGEMTRMVGTSLDITDRRQAEDALRASEESYRTIFDLAGDAIYVHDPETGAVLDANRQACELHGCTLDELKAGGIGGVSAGGFFNEERARELVRQASAGQPQRFEWQGRHSSGAAVWVEVDLQHVKILGADRVVASVRNITERKQAEEALQRSYAELERRVQERTEELAAANRALESEIAEHRHAREQLLQRSAEAERAREAAERANRAKSEFLSRMSHELRTPLNSILGFSQVLERGELTGNQNKSVQHILKAGRHLLQLINEVLEIARIEAGRHNLSLEPVAVGLVLQEAMSLVRPIAAELHVDVTRVDHDRDHAYVQADRQRLVQVLLNLLSNAIKYNRPGGRVQLSCAAAPAAGDEPARLCVRVQDTGSGIPADRLDELFTPFSRLGTEQSGGEGTGLGLALSQRLVEAMDGTLVLEETGPAGSVFRLELQLAVSPLGRLEEAAGAAMKMWDDTPHAPASLLYIEDNLANLSLLETILDVRPKWTLLPALQGGIGIELARKHAPDVILLDLHLPDMSGIEVFRRLRADERTAAIPVVVISADATPSTIERLLADGAAAFLTKPLDVDEFLHALDLLLPPQGFGSKPD